MQAITIRKIGEDSRLEGSGQIVRQIRVEYMIGEHGPFTQSFPREGFSAPAARMQLEQFAADLSALTG
jgi:hypothetical protein